MSKYQQIVNLETKQELIKFCSNIKLARKRRKITLKLMSEKSGASVAILTRLEAGDPSVAFGTVMQILSVLGLIRGISGIVLPENDIEQVMSDIKNIRLRKKTTIKNVFKEDDLNF